mgnify:CR=1 FL=1
MKKTKFIAFLLSATLVFSGCGNMNNTTKGGLIGGGGGAALGAIIGGIAGHGKGAAIGAAVGAAVGTGAGVLIGKKMDKAAAEAAQIQGAQVEQVTDNNGLQAVKVTFDSGILFKHRKCFPKSSSQISIEQIRQQCIESEQRHGRIHIWLHRQSRLEKQHCRTKHPKRTSTCLKNVHKAWQVIC